MQTKFPKSIHKVARNVQWDGRYGGHASCRIKRDGQYYVKSFSLKNHGSYEKACAAAIAWRDEMEKVLGDGYAASRPDTAYTQDQFQEIEEDDDAPRTHRKPASQLLLWIQERKQNQEQDNETLYPMQTPRL